MNSKDIIEGKFIEKSVTTGDIVVTSKDMIGDELIERTVKLGDTVIKLGGITSIGAPNKKFNEDGCAVLKYDKNLMAVVVDGGTQVQPVSSLNDISGGKYIADSVVEFATTTDPNQPATAFLNQLNSRLREKNRKEHPEISYDETSMNVPYGSIAAIRINTEDNLVEVANAGDIFVLVVDKDGEPSLITKDDVYQKDQQTFSAANTAAREHKVTIRKAMEQRDRDPRFTPILEEMYETMRLGNIGTIPRITGSEVFRSHNVTLSLHDIAQLLVFSDGAIPINIDIHAPEGQKAFIKLIKETGLANLRSFIEASAQQDPDFENHPRFRDIDNLMILQLDFE